ncbi:MAG: group 1 glycosyl transferase [Candidatus Peribacteria bacterium]|nr:group 1 glycosyl transferase [Candidatus Peribacteria bacterium]
MRVMQPRIVIFSAFATPFRSGAEACSEEVARELKDQFDIVIVTARLRRSLPRDDVLASGVKMKRVGLGFGIDKWLFPFLAPFAARKLQPVILHAVLESYAGLALLVSRFVLPHAGRLLTLQSTNTSFLLRPLHASAHRLTAISSVLVERGRALGFPAIRLIPNGIPLQSIQEATHTYGKMPGRLLYVGRLEPMKGVDILIRAFSAIAPQFPAAILHIVGDGSLRQAIGEQIHSAGLGPRIRFCGYLSNADLYRQYAEAEIFCGLSRSEALGNVFLEAQAAGCAIVATAIGGIPDIVQDGETGYLVPADDAAAASQKISALLAGEGIRHSMAEKGKVFAAAYDWSVIAAQYAEEYQALLR